MVYRKSRKEMVIMKNRLYLSTIVQDLDILSISEHWMNENGIKLQQRPQTSLFFTWKYREWGGVFTYSKKIATKKLISLDKWTIEGKIEFFGVKINM